MKLKRFKDVEMGEEIWDVVKTPDIIINRKNNNKWWILSTILIIFLCISSVSYYEIHKKSIYDQYYTSENIIDVKRGDNVDAIYYFQNKDFERSSILFKNILKQDSTDITIRFYYGINCMELNKYDESIKSFNYIINQNDNLYVEHAIWYLGLCYLKIDNKEKAIEQFNIASNQDNYHHKEAKEIIIKLNDN